MTTWPALLDDYETAIAGLEDAVAAGVAPAGRPWRPPAELPDDLPTGADQRRFAELRARAAAVVPRLAAASAAAADELETVRRTGAAARAYGRTELLAGRDELVPEEPHHFP